MSQIRLPFEDFREEFSKQTIPKKYAAWFEKALPEAESELAKPKEDRMFIERPKKKRSSKKRSVAPTKSTPKKTTPAKAPRPAPEEEEDVEESEDDEAGSEAEDEEAEVQEDSEESEAEFDESPKESKSAKRDKQTLGEVKKKIKKPAASKKPSLSTAQLVDKYRVKSYPEGASKKVTSPLVTSLIAAEPSDLLRPLYPTSLYASSHWWRDKICFEVKWEVLHGLPSKEIASPRVHEDET
jgi:hypothetical protein